jgi:glycogen debranching enzyme
MTEIQAEKGALVIRREREQSDRMEETLWVQNFANEELEVPLELTFAAGFDTIFKVRGAPLGRRGVLHRPRWENGALVFRYPGVDSRFRTTRLHFDPEPDLLDQTTARYRLTLPPSGSSRRLRTRDRACSSFI